jgi:hypothetical protein
MREVNVRASKELAQAECRNETGAQGFSAKLEQDPFQSEALGYASAIEFAPAKVLLKTASRSFRAGLVKSRVLSIP